MVALKLSVLSLLTLALLVSESFAHWWMKGYRKPRPRFRYRYKPSYYYKNKYDMYYRRQADPKSYTYMQYSKKMDTDMPTFYKPHYYTNSYYRKPYSMEKTRKKYDDYRWKYRSKYYMYKPKHRKSMEDDSYMTYDKHKRYTDSHMRYAASQPTYEQYYQKSDDYTGKHVKYMDLFPELWYQSDQYNKKKDYTDKDYAKWYDFAMKHYAKNYKEKKYLHKLFLDKSSMYGDDDSKSYEKYPYKSYKKGEMYDNHAKKYEKYYKESDKSYDTDKSYYTERKYKKDRSYPDYDKTMYEKDTPYFKLGYKSEYEKMKYKDTADKHRNKYDVNGDYKRYKKWNNYIEFLNEHAFGEGYIGKDKRYSASYYEKEKDNKYDAHKKRSYYKKQKEDEKYYEKESPEYKKGKYYYLGEKKYETDYNDKGKVDYKYKPDDAKYLYHKSKREKHEHYKHKHKKDDYHYKKKDESKYYKMANYHKKGDESPLLKSYLLKKMHDKYYDDKSNYETTLTKYKPYKYIEKTYKDDKSEHERAVIYLDPDTLYQYFLQAKKSHDREDSYRKKEKYAHESLFPLEPHYYIDAKKKSYDKKDESDKYGPYGKYFIKKKY